MAPQSLPDPDFPCPFRNGHQHDVHDTDAPHQEADSGHNGQQQGNGPGGLLGGLDDFRQIPDGKVVIHSRLDLVPGPEERHHIGLDLGHSVFILALDGNVPDIGEPHEPLHGCGQGNEHNVILVLSHSRLSLGSQHPDHRKGSLVDPHDLPTAFPSGNRVSATVFPMTHTRSRPFISRWLYIRP